MGTWSASPVGNDDAADWAYELDDASDWGIVIDALDDALETEPNELDADIASVALAAAETVAHGLGRPTQSDAYTETIAAFAGRVSTPGGELRAQALRAVDHVAHPDGELAELWEESDPAAWADALDRLREALSGTGRDGSGT
ncbi:MAG TPA: DUF4259 domain-containing protein [Microcella sp.]|nr:DUF4259 domain-containing protein [Microcella sp.]